MDLPEAVLFVIWNLSADDSPFFGWWWLLHTNWSDLDQILVFFSATIKWEDIVEEL